MKNVLFYTIGIEDDCSLEDSSRHILLTTLAFDKESDALDCAAALQKSRSTFFRGRKFVVCVFNENTQPF